LLRGRPGDWGVVYVPCVAVSATGLFPCLPDRLLRVT
jgi:hypothetical protein